MWYTCVYLVQENRNLIPDLWKASAVKVGTPGKTFVFRFIVSYWRTNDEIIVWVLQEVPFYSYCFKWITVQHCERFLKALHIKNVLINTELLAHWCSNQWHPECQVRAIPCWKMIFPCTRTLFFFQTFQLQISLICSCEISPCVPLLEVPP